jgi:hypothetical protein
MITRRGLLRGILAAGIAPAFIKAEILMPVRQIIVPAQEIYTGGIDMVEKIYFAASRDDPLAQRARYRSGEFVVFAHSSMEPDLRQIMKGRA